MRILISAAITLLTSTSAAASLPGFYATDIAGKPRASCEFVMSIVEFESKHVDGLKTDRSGGILSVDNGGLLYEFSCQSGRLMSRVRAAR